MVILLQVLSVLIILSSLWAYIGASRSSRSVAELKQSAQEIIRSDADAPERIAQLSNVMKNWLSQPIHLEIWGVSAWLRQEIIQISENLELNHFHKSANGNTPAFGTIQFLTPKNIFEWLIAVVLMNWVIHYSQATQFWQWSATPIAALTIALVLNKLTQQKLLSLRALIDHLGHQCSQPFYDKSLEHRIANTLVEVGSHMSLLKSSLSDHIVAVEQLPQNFAAEVREGLQNTVNKLGETLESFQVLLDHTPNLAQMPSWLAKLEQSILPLKEVGIKVAGLSDHNETILKNLAAVVNETAKERRMFLSQATATSEGLDEWTSNQEVMTVYFQGKLDDFLVKMNTITSETQQAMETVSKFTESTGKTLSLVGERLPDTVSALEGSGEALQKTSTLYKETAEMIHSQTKQLRLGFWIIGGIALVTLLVTVYQLVIQG